MAGSLWRKGISPQSLTDRLGGGAGDILTEEPVGGHHPLGNELNRIVDLSLEFSGRAFQGAHSKSKVERESASMQSETLERKGGLACQREPV